MIPERYSLAIDGYYMNPVADNPGFIAEVIEDVANQADMRLLDVTVRNVDASIPQGEGFVDEGGISAHGLISTSHICLHTWPNSGFFMFDLVSCRRFDPERIKELVLRELKVKTVEREAVYPIATT